MDTLTAERPAAAATTRGAVRRRERLFYAGMFAGWLAPWS